MGYVVIHTGLYDNNTRRVTIFGDENAYNRDHGLPHIAKDGRRVTAEDIRREDESGLGA